MKIEDPAPLGGAKGGAGASGDFTMPMLNRAVRSVTVTESKAG